MQTLNDGAQNCAKPEIVAGRLISIRNIYLRLELRTISNKIQEKYKERLPALNLVSIAAYEQVFNRQPLSLPEELREEAIKYGLQYYQLHYEKLRTAEAQNGLYPNHDGSTCLDENCPFHGSNIIALDRNLLKEAHIDGTQSDLLDSKILRKTKNEYNSNESILTIETSDNTFDSTPIDTKSNTTSVSSNQSSTVATNEHDFSSTSSFADTVISPSLTDISSDIDSNSTSTDSFSESASNRSIIITKTDQLSPSTKKFSRDKPPQIIVRRASDNSLTSNDSKNSSVTVSRNQTYTKKQPTDIHRLSPNTQKTRKKKKKNKH